MLRLRALAKKDQKTDTRTRTFTISNEVKDRHRTVIKADGWQLDNYRANPVVMYAHAANKVPDPDLVIGTGNVYRDGTDLVGEIDFEEGNPIAEKVLRKIDKGVLRAVSVGFEPKKSSWGDQERGEDPDTFYFREQELLEFSVVPVPSNAGTLKRDIDDIMEYGEMVKDWDDIKADKLNDWFEVRFDIDPELREAFTIPEEEEKNEKVNNRVKFWKARF